MAASGWFAQLAARYESAAAAVGSHEEELEIAGVPVRARFAGAAMRDLLLPPFEHLRSAAARPGPLISVFDTASTGVAPPPPAWEAVTAAPGTNPRTLLRGDGCTILVSEGTGAITAAAPARGEAIFHLPDASRISPIERAVPLRDALAMLMAPRGRWMTHAGAVGRGGRGVLVVGAGGSGKSTLCLACARAGMEIAADDYVLLEPGPPAAHAMQSTGKLTEDSAERLGVAADALDPAGFEPTLEGPPKALVEIEAVAPGALRRRLEIAALVLPRLAGAEAPRMEPVAAARGLQALAPSTVFQAGFGGRETLAALGGLARRVPSFELSLSPDPAADAAAVDELVAGLA